MSDQGRQQGADSTGKSFLRILSVFLVSLWALSLPGCITEVRGPGSWNHDKASLYSEQVALGFEPILGRYSVDPALGSDLDGLDRVDPSSLFAPFHQYERTTYLHADGSVTLHYYLEPGLGDKVRTLLLGQVNGLTDGKGAPPTAINQVSVMANFVTDKRETSASGPKGFMAHNVGPTNACDLLLVRTTNETLVDVENFIRKFLVEVPMVEIKVRILEVTYSDNIQYGITGDITKETGGNPLFKGMTTHFNTEEMIGAGGFTVDDLRTWFDPDQANVDPGFQGGFYIVEGVHDKLRLQAALELLQRTSDTEILSAPKIRVLNGHKAIIETVREIPIPKAKVGVSSTQYEYEYKPVGVTMAVLPMRLMNGTLQIQVTTDVSTITGEEQFTTGQGTGSVSIPVISNRGASTAINVKEDQAFMLAGLIDRSEIEVVSKVPFLGDIPVLGFLFKSRQFELKRTQIIFYIEPRVIPPTEVLYGLED